MTWDCPKCSKSFARRNQSHKCEGASDAELFYGKDPNLYPIYKEFLKFVSSFTQPVITSSKKAITLYAPTQKSFLIIRPKTEYLEISFPLARKAISPQFQKIVPASSKVFFHFFLIDKREPWDQIWKNYILEAYNRVLF